MLPWIQSFGCVNSYLQTKTFTQKRDCAISSKLQIPRRYNQDYFRNPLKASINAMKNNYPKTAHTFFTGRSIFSYFLVLNC